MLRSTTYGVTSAEPRKKGKWSGNTEEHRSDGGGALGACSRPRSAPTVSFPFIVAQQRLRRDMPHLKRGKVERETRRSTAPTVAVPWARARGQDPHRQSHFPAMLRSITYVVTSAEPREKGKWSGKHGGASLRRWRCLGRVLAAKICTDSLVSPQCCVVPPTE